MRTRRVFISGLVVAVVLAISANLTPRISLSQLSLLCGVPLVLACLRWPGFGPVALILVSLSIPVVWELAPRLSSMPGILFLSLLLGIWLVHSLLHHQSILPRSQTVPPLVLLSAVAILATVAGSQPYLPLAQLASLPAQLGGLAVFLLSIGAFFFAADRLRDIRWLAGSLWLFAAIAGLDFIRQFVPALAALTPSMLQPGADGSLFWTWLAALTSSQVFFNNHLGRGWRFLLAMVLLAAISTGYVAKHEWTSGWLPSLVAVVVVVTVGAPRRMLALFLLASPLLLLKLQSFVEASIVQGNEYSLTTRLEAWNILAQIISLNPVLGLGPANYYWYTPLFPIDGYAVVFNSHNNYIDLIAQTGFLGLACFLWFAGATWHLAWHLRLRAPLGFPRAYIYGALGGLAGTLVAGMFGDWFLPFTYNIGLLGFRASILAWLFLGGLVALDQALAMTEGRPESRLHAPTLRPRFSKAQV